MFDYYMEEGQYITINMNMVLNFVGQCNALKSGPTHKSTHETNETKE